MEAGTRPVLAGGLLVAVGVIGRRHKNAATCKSGLPPSLKARLEVAGPIGRPDDHFLLVGVRCCKSASGLVTAILVCQEQNRPGD